MRKRKLQHNTALEIFSKAFFCCFEVGKERGDIYIQDIRRGDYRERKDNMLCYLLQTGKKTPIEKENKFFRIFLHFFKLFFELQKYA